MFSDSHRLARIWAFGAAINGISRPCSIFILVLRFTQNGDQLARGDGVMAGIEGTVWIPIVVNAVGGICVGQVTKVWHGPSNTGQNG